METGYALLTCIHVCKIHKYCSKQQIVAGIKIKRRRRFLLQYRYLSIIDLIQYKVISTFPTALQQNILNKSICIMIPVAFATQNRFCLEKHDYPNVDISSKMDLLIRCEHLFSLL